MEHNRKPSKPADRKDEQHAAPIPINIKALFSNLEAARKAFADNTRGSLTDGGRADVLSQKILHLLDSLCASRQRIDDATFILGMEVVNLDRHHGGSSVAPAELGNELQQRFEQSAGQVRLLESKLATSQAIIEDLRNQLTSVNNELAAAILSAGELKVAAAASRTDAAARLEAMTQRANENKNLSSANDCLRNELSQSKMRLAAQAGEFAQRESDLRQKIGELCGLLETQEAAKRQLELDLTKSEAEKLRTTEALTERCAQVNELQEQLAAFEDLLAQAAEDEKNSGGGTGTATGDDAKLLEQIRELKAKIREQEAMLGKYAAAIKKSSEVIQAMETRNATLETEAKRSSDTIADLERKIEDLNRKLVNLDIDFGKVREAFRRHRDETDEKLEEATEENRSQTLEINALRDANAQAARKSAEAAAELRAEIERLEKELTAAQAEIESLKKSSATDSTQATALEEARKVADGILGGIKASEQLLAKMMSGTRAYDPTKLTNESERRRLHQVMVEDRIADTEEVLNRLELDIESLENLPGKCAADELLLQEKVAESKRVNRYLEDLQRISESLSSDQTLLLRLHDAQQLVEKGLPDGLLGGDLPAIPESVFQAPKDEAAAAPGAEPTAEVKSVEPPDQTQEKQLVLWKLAKEHELTQQAILIATLYDRIPGRRKGYALKHVIESAALANILQKFGWGDEQVHEILHSHWRGEHRQLRQSDRYLPLSRGNLPNAFVRTQLPLPWDASLLLTGKEIAEFQRWFQTSFK
ncbi:MAG: hypothetical protein WC551_02380 [Patescibacteria group bacterium]